MNKRLIAGIAAVILVVILVVVFALPKSPKYTFYAGKDSDGGDIVYKGELANNVAGLQAACNATPGCVGFNTNGFLKKSISPQPNWVSWTSDPTKGLYVQQ